MPIYLGEDEIQTDHDVYIGDELVYRDMPQDKIQLVRSLGGKVYYDFDRAGKMDRPYTSPHSNVVFDLLNANIPVTYTNMLTNGDFEADAVGATTITGFSVVGGACEISNTVSHSGSKSLKMTQINTSNYAYNFLTTVVGHVYHVSVWVYIESISVASPRLQVEGVAVTVDVSKVGQWQKLNLLYTATGASSSFLLYNSGTGTWVAYWDEAMVIDLTTLGYASLTAEAGRLAFPFTNTTRTVNTGYNGGLVNFAGTTASGYDRTVTIDDYEGTPVIYNNMVGGSDGISNLTGLGLAGQVYSVANNEITFTALSADYQEAYVTPTLVVGHVYILMVDMLSNSALDGIKVQTGGSGYTYHSGSSQYERLGVIFTCTATTTELRLFNSERTGSISANPVKLKSCMLVDLTLLESQFKTLSGISVADAKTCFPFTPQGTPKTINVKMDSFAKFDGSNDYIDTNFPASAFPVVAGVGSFWVYAKVKIGALGAGKGICGVDRSSTTNHGFLNFTKASSNKMLFGVFITSGCMYYIEGNVAQAAGDIVEVVGILDMTQMTRVISLYINGILQTAQGTFTGTILDPVGNLVVGCRYYNNAKTDWWNGNIYEFALGSGVPTQDEITELCAFN